MKNEKQMQPTFKAKLHFSFFSFSVYLLLRILKQARWKATFMRIAGSHLCDSSSL